MKTQWFWLFLIYGCFLLNAAVTLPIVDEEVLKPQEGRICGFGDLNKDRYTDLIVQNQFTDKFTDTLTVLIQSENGKFSQSPNKFPPIKLISPGLAICAVADFNGDALPDIMVTFESATGNFVSVIYVNDETAFVPYELMKKYTFSQPPTIVDINGDGHADIVGFLDDGTFICLKGTKDSEMMVDCTSEAFPNHEIIQNPYRNFPHIFADLDNDLSSEIVFALEHPSNSKRIYFQTWKLHDLAGNKGIWTNTSAIPEPPVQFNYYGSGVVADFDADGYIDILIPGCLNKPCNKVEYIMIYSHTKGWVHFQLDLKDASLVVEDNGQGPVFRVGDFTLDGYPDLIATVSKGNSVMPVIFENVEYSGNANFSRKFEMMVSNKIPQLVIPSEMAQGRIKMAAFFDLKEDGTLDILVEYADASGSLKFNFIRCDDKGDTTFLKVQIFSNVCTRSCKNSNPNEIGSGIPWHGACASFSMPDSYGNTRKSSQCQLPQTSQRALHSPFLLFGLGRSPNFIDEVKLGSPRLPITSTNNQHFALKQIVPNSRIIVVPPENNDVHWLSRLYLTPSQLIIQSVAVLFSVCIILVILIVFLHYRERQQDRKERQAQLHRFHFDAM